MTSPYQTPDVRACTHTENPPPGRRPTSTNTPGRPSLRVVPGPTHIETTPPQPRPAHDRTTLADLRRAFTNHHVTGTHPPTVAETAATLWPDRDQVRHGLAGQLGAAAAGLIQIVGLAATWATAHVLFATRTRAAIFALLTVLTLTAFAITSHT